MYSYVPPFNVDSRRGSVGGWNCLASELPARAVAGGTGRLGLCARRPKRFQQDARARGLFFFQSGCEQRTNEEKEIEAP